jgi:hypothetical protein
MKRTSILSALAILVLAGTLRAEESLVSGMVLERKGLTLSIVSSHGNELVRQEITIVRSSTLQLSADAQGKVHAATADDLKLGTEFTATIDGDGTSIMSLTIQGKKVSGTILAVEKGEIALVTEVGGFRLTPNTQVTIYDANKKTTTEAKVADLKPKTRVQLRLSASDGSVSSVRVE